MKNYKPTPPSEARLKSARFGWLNLLLAGLVLLAPMSGLAYTVADSSATNAIVGEAASCPYIVKLGIASAIRNRESLHGVYGYHAAHNQYESQQTWAEARRAWLESAQHDYVYGARFFGTKADVAKGYFAGMTLTCVLGTGKHAFYFYR